MAHSSTLSKTDPKIDELVLEADISYVAAVFDTVDEAKAAYKKLKYAQYGGNVHVIDAAYVEKTKHNRLIIHDRGEWVLGEGILGGGVAGSLIGIIAGAILLPAAIGALIGGVMYGMYEQNAKFSHKDLREMADTLPTGTSALVAIVADEFLGAVEMEVKKIGGKKVHSNKIPKSTFDSLAASK